MSRMNMPPGPGRPKGMKNKATLLKEERRAIFDAEMSQMFKEKIHEARAEYLLDQFIGTATQKIEHSGEIKGGEIIAPELVELAKKELKKRLKSE